VTSTATVAALEQALAQRIGLPRYQLWFAPHTRFRLDDGHLVVGVPNLHFQEWLSKTFTDAVQSAARTAFGEAVPVRFQIDPELFRAARAAEAEAPGSGAGVREEAAVPTKATPARKAAPKPTPSKGRSKKQAPPGPTIFDPPPPCKTATPPPAAPAPRATSAEPRTRTPEPRKRRWHHLNDFVVGSCNRVAHAAALSVVEEPGQGPNPLVVHGPVGTGKTHLLEGVYAGLRKAAPDWRVIFVTAEDFTNRFVQALRFGKQPAFRKHFRDCDALLLDDLHFLVSKRASHEEFLHTLDSLLTDGKQVVVTCDCHPRLADDFPPELTDRLLGGAVWGLQPPDPATRLDLLRAKAGRAEPVIAEEVLRFLGEQLRGNVRELEGALTSLRHYARVTGRRIDVPLAREALGELLRHAVRVVQVPDVDAAVCKVLRLPAGTLQSKARAWSVSHPRMLAIHLARKHTAASYGEIGQHFGGRNHSTAVAAEKRVRQWLAADGTLTAGERPWRVRELVELVERELGR
jgi:chromosomal replication initiator protein